MIELGRIRLRAWEKEDLRDVHRWENDFQTMLYSRGRPHSTVPYSDIDEKYENERKNESRMHYIIELRDERKAIGTAVIRKSTWSSVNSGNIGTYIDRKYWNMGLGKEVTLALLEIAFYFSNFDRCEAYSIEYNTRAHKVLEFCGFKRSGRMRKGAYVFGKYWDWLYFDILRDEYFLIRDEKIRDILGKRAEEYLDSVTLNHG